MTQEKKVAQLKELLSQAIKILVNEEIVDYHGHISARVPDSEQVLITPALNIAKVMQAYEPEDMVTVDLEGNKIAGQFNPPKELWLHLAAYRARPDIMSVIHGHPTACIAMSLSNQPVVPLHRQAAGIASGVPVLETSAHIDTPEMGERMVKTLGRHNALLLKWHGVVVVGSDVQEAVTIAVGLEKNIQIQVMASALASGPQMEAQPLQEISLTSLRGPVAWQYFLSRLKFNDRRS